MSQIANKFLAQVPTLTLKGNNTGSTANVADLTVAQVNAILPVFTSSLNGLTPLSGGGTTNFLRADGTWAMPPASGGTVTSFSFTNGGGFTGTVTSSTSTPTLSLTGTLTGDVTGSLTATTLTATTNSTLTTLSALSLPGSQVTGNISGNAANVTGTVSITNGGTGQTTAAAAFNALNPMTTTGDMIYESSTGVAARLPIGSSNQVLTVISGIPSWQTATTGANQTLSNLTSPTAVNQNLLPGTTNTLTLGNSSALWNNLYVTTITGPTTSTMTITSANTTTSNSGAVDITSGTTSTGNSGAVSITSGASSSGGVTGTVSMYSGSTSSSSVTTGAALLQTGNNSAGSTGAAELTTGSASGSGQSSGNILLQTGLALSSATRGLIQFKNGTEGTSGQVWTSTDTNGSGSWSAAPAPSLNASGGIVNSGGLAINVDTTNNTTKINGSNQLESQNDFQESFTLTGTDITNQYKDLSHAVSGSSSTVNSVNMSAGGVTQLKGTDYTVSLTGGASGVTRISFAGGLATGGVSALVSGDVLVFTYSYLP